jgi:hypothetical protein
MIVDKESGSTLVLYVYSESSQTHRQNLQFFLKYGVKASNRVHYLFVMQGCHDIDIPKLANVQVLERENTCFDIGAWGIGLKHLQAQLAKFSFFIFMNASVRGPFLPTYAEAESWPQVFTRLLDAKVKLVGTTIHCMNQPSLMQEFSAFKNMRHVQSMAFATDSIGLEVLTPLLQPCHTEKLDATFKGEIPISQAFLSAGYGIQSLQLAFGRQPVGGHPALSGPAASAESEARTQAACDEFGRDDGGDPYFPGTYGGIDIHPLEVVFIKNTRSKPVSAAAIGRYTAWMGGVAAQDFALPVGDRSGVELSGRPCAPVAVSQQARDFPCGQTTEGSADACQVRLSDYTMTHAKDGARARCAASPPATAATRRRCACSSSCARWWSTTNSVTWRL